MKTAIICDERYIQHLTGKGHPECPERYTVIVKALTQNDLKNAQNTSVPRFATEQDILLCHTKNYLETVKINTLEAKALNLLSGEYTLSTGDVQICPDSLEVALLAVGGVLTGVDVVMTQKAQNAFCVVRPPGHHASQNKGMGFCLFNNVAIGARYAQKAYGIERVLIVDWDVHHGNGTQDIFEEDPSVFYFSTHQAALYPHTGYSHEQGKSKGLGTTFNIPIFSSPQSRIEVLQAFSIKLVEAMKNFRPDLIFISAGFDAHASDPLGGFNLEDEDFAELTRIVKEIAKAYAKGRLISVLEGGYNLNALATASVAHVKALNE